MKVLIQAIAMGLLISSNLYADDVAYFSVFNCTPSVAQDADQGLVKAKILTQIAKDDHSLLLELKQPWGMMMGNTAVLKVKTKIVNDEEGKPKSLNFFFNNKEILSIDTSATEVEFTGKFVWQDEVTPILCKSAMLDDAPEDAE